MDRNARTSESARRFEVGPPRLTNEVQLRAKRVSCNAGLGLAVIAEPVRPLDVRVGCEMDFLCARTVREWS